MLIQESALTLVPKNALIQNFGMRPRSWLDVGPKSWFTEYMGIQESASTLVPKNSLIRNLVMRPRSWLDVGPKSWFTECMGIQESASTLVPKDSLIRNLKVSRSRNKIVMQKLLRRSERTNLFFYPGK